jgi:hypothetical protein
LQIGAFTDLSREHHFEQFITHVMILPRNHS